MEEYTQGPWNFKIDSNWHIVDGGNNSLMCDEQYYPWNSTNKADWHLISAAPEMLESLKRMVATFDDGTVMFKEAGGIIQKAEGSDT